MPLTSLLLGDDEEELTSSRLDSPTAPADLSSPLLGDADDDPGFVSDPGLVSDLGVSAASGAAGLVETMGNIYGLATGDFDNLASTKGGEWREELSKRKSDELLADEDFRSKAVEAADGELAKAGTAFWETVSNPRLLASFVAEQLPMMTPIGAAGRVAQVGSKAAGLGAKAAARIGTGAAVGTGAIMQGSDAGTSAYDQLLGLPDELWDLDPDVVNAEDREQAKRDKALSLSRNAAIASGIASVGLNMLPGARALERSLAGVKIPGTSRLKSAATGFLGETVQEAGEEGFGALAANIAVGEVDPDQATFEGVGEAAGMGAAGGVFGAVAGGLQTPTDTTKDLLDIEQTISQASDFDEMLDDSNAIVAAELDEAPANQAMKLAMEKALASSQPTALEPTALENIFISRELPGAEGMELVDHQASEAMIEIDARIDGMKKLIACVNR